MKTSVNLLSLLSLAGLLMTTGCEVEEHGRGGYYGPQESVHGNFYYHHDHDWDDHRGGYWDRGHYYHD